MAQDDQSGPQAEARRDWLEQELGDDWVAQGDGTYRFVGATSDAPIARDDSQPSGEERADAREPRHPRLPWRRH